MESYRKTEAGMVELHNLPDSPVFPPRTGATSGSLAADSRDKKGERAAAFFDHHDHQAVTDRSSSSSSTTQSGGDRRPPNLSLISDSCSDSPTQATSSSGEKSPSKLRRKLHFAPTEVLNLVRKSGDQSPTTKRTVGGFTTWGDGEGKYKDPQILKSDKLFTVSANDMSVLERISHRAQHRSVRIRKPHEIFVELEEIRMDESDGLEWAETARWIKFEEDVEEGTGRWGRPHISALTFHSLVELQQGIDKGSVMLDVEGDTFPAIADEITHNLELSGIVDKEAAEGVRTLLLKRHRHPKDVNFWGKVKNSSSMENGRKTGNDSSSEVHHFNGKATNHTHHQGPNRKNTLSKYPLLEEVDDEDVEKSHSDSGVQSPTTSNVTKRVSFLDNTTNEVPAIDSSSHNTGSAHTSQVRSSVPLMSGPDRDDSKVAVDIDSSIKEEGEGEEKEKEEEKPVGSSHGLRSLLRKNSIIDVIPEEAESITVMVGGVKFLEKPITAFIRLNQGLHLLPLDFPVQSHLLSDLTEVPVPVRFIFLMIGPDDSNLNYHEVGRCMATLMSDAQFHEIAYSAVCKEDLLDGIEKFLDDSIVLPPGDWDEDLLLPAMHERNELRRRKEHHQDMVDSYRKLVTEPMHHSRRPFGGIYKDFKKLFSRYPSDFKDAFNLHVLVSIFFLYISFVAPAIAFGGLMEEVTNNIIGESETLFGAGLGGIMYGLLAVQPLTIQAFVGPVLVYESIIYRFAIDYNLPYIEWRELIGLWLMVILLVMALGELTFLVHYFTRFSEEIFIGITGFFFLYEACLSIVHIFERNPLCGLNYPCGKGVYLTNTCMKINKSSHYTEPYYLNYSNTSEMEGSGMMYHHNATEPSLPQGFRICNQPNTALWSFILAVMTFLIALFLRKLRFKKCLGKKARRLVSDFGMFTALSSMVLVSYFMQRLVPVEVLLVSSGYQVSTPSARGWLINPFNGTISIGLGFAAFIPAALLSILIFIENQLALLTVNKPEHKLTKPVGYHLDLALVGILAGFSGVLGLPFLCGAPIRSLQQLQALSVYTKKQAPGEKPSLVRIHEQRVTTIVVHILIVLTPFASDALRIIPICVVLGVFFYLAYASILAVQLSKRIKLIFVYPKYHPDLQYVRKVRTWKMHLYTVIQVACILVLYGVKLSPGVSLCYPLFIVLLLPFRWLLGKCVFTKEELDALDSDDTETGEIHDSPELGEFASTHAPY